jgi:hypothetical protein
MAFVPKLASKSSFIFAPKSKSILSFDSRIPGIPPTVLFCNQTSRFFVYEYGMDIDGISSPTMMCTVRPIPSGEYDVFIQTSDGRNVERVKSLKEFICKKFHVNDFKAKLLERQNVVKHITRSHLEGPQSFQYIQNRKKKSENQRKKIVEKRRSKVFQLKTSSKKRLPLKLQSKGSYTRITL